MQYADRYFLTDGSRKAPCLQHGDIRLVYRRKVLVDKVAERLFKLIPKAALRYRAEVMALGIRPDHVGGAPLEVIKQYVDNQKNV